MKILKKAQNNNKYSSGQKVTDGLKSKSENSCPDILLWTIRDQRPCNNQNRTGNIIWKKVRMIFLFISLWQWQQILYLKKVGCCRMNYYVCQTVMNEIFLGSTITRQMKHFWIIFLFYKSPRHSSKTLNGAPVTAPCIELYLGFSYEYLNLLSLFTIIFCEL